MLYNTFGKNIIMYYLHTHLNKKNTALIYEGHNFKSGNGDINDIDLCGIFSFTF